MDTAAPLVVAAHGTADPDGRALIEQCAAAAASRLQVPHAVGYVDVCRPTLEETLAAMSTDPIVVPLFLASGYHARHDVPSAVAAQRPNSRVTPALGVEPEVADALIEAIAKIGPTPDGVVLTAAGSSHPGARAEVAAVGDLLADRIRRPVITTFLVGSVDPARAAIAQLRAEGIQRLVIAAHLLGGGVFLSRAVALGETEGLAVTGPLAQSSAIVDLVVRRYREMRASIVAHQDMGF